MALRGVFKKTGIVDDPVDNLGHNIIALNQFGSANILCFRPLPGQPGLCVPAQENQTGGGTLD